MEASILLSLVLRGAGEHKPYLSHSSMNKVSMCAISSPLINLLQDKGLKDRMLEL